MGVQSCTSLLVFVCSDHAVVAQYSYAHVRVQKAEALSEGTLLTFLGAPHEVRSILRKLQEGAA
jgi:hypothetical protein